MSIPASGFNPLLAPEPKRSGDLPGVLRSTGTFAQGVLVLFLSLWVGRWLLSFLPFLRFIQAVFALLYVMGLYSMVAVTERSLTYRTAHIQSRTFIREAAGVFRAGNLAAAVEIAKRYPASPMARVIFSGLESYLTAAPWLSGAGAIELAKRSRGTPRIVNRSARAVHREMKHRLPMLASISATAPLIGVFGTLVGIIGSFHGYGIARSALIAILSTEISESLAPAALGMLVALPTLWFYEYLSGRLEAIDTEMEIESIDLVNCLILCEGRNM